MRKMTQLTGALALALLGVACQSMPEGGDAPSADLPRDSAAGVPAGVTGSVRLTLDRSSYRAGSPVTLQLANQTSRTFGYNPCTRTIERLRDGAWTLYPEPDRICTMELRLLEASGSIATQTELPPGISRGTYRMSIALSDETASQAGPQRAVSGTFTVE